MIRQVISASVLLAAIAAPAASAETCMRPDEERADKIRFVQTHFMVAALQCRFGEDKTLSALYNNFVADHNSHLIASEQPLRSYLNRNGGVSLDTYMAELANTVSLASIEMTNFCGRTRQVAELAPSASTPENLVELMPVRYRRPSERCGISRNARGE